MARRGPGTPGAEEPARTWPPARSFPACAKGRPVPIPPANAVTWRSAPGSLWRLGAHSPGPGSRRQEAVEGGGRQGCDGGGGGAGGLGAPAGWEDRAQNGCWAKEGSRWRDLRWIGKGRMVCCSCLLSCLNHCRTVDLECLVFLVVAR